MDIRVNEVSFKGIGARTIGKVLIGTTMGLGVMTACQNKSFPKDTFNKNAEYVTLNAATNKNADTTQMINTLKQTGFVPQEESKIISSMMATLGIETIGCITTEDNMVVYGECNSELYKFYVRKSNDELYYGFVDKLVPGKAPDFADDPENTNKSYAFVLKDVNGKNPAECKQVTFSELGHYDDEYCNNFMFGFETYDKTNDIKYFQTTFLSNDVNNRIYTLEQ